MGGSNSFAISVLKRNAERPTHARGSFGNLLHVGRLVSRSAPAPCDNLRACRGPISSRGPGHISFATDSPRRRWPRPRSTPKPRKRPRLESRLGRNQLRFAVCQSSTLNVTALSAAPSSIRKSNRRGTGSGEASVQNSYLDNLRQRRRKIPFWRFGRVRSYVRPFRAARRRA